jgi:P2 family phage contractile tail tube protein
MSAASNILKNFNLYIDGRGYSGNVDEVQLPNLGIVGEDYRAGGMDAPIELDMGMEKLESTFTLSKFDADVDRLFSTPGFIALTFRGAVESLDGTVRPVIVKMKGKIHGIETGAATPGAKVGKTYRVPLVAFSYTLDGVAIHDIDVLNMKRVIGGVDRLAEQRRAIGL